MNKVTQKAKKKESKLSVLFDSIEESSGFPISKIKSSSNPYTLDPEGTENEDRETTWKDWDDGWNNYGK